MARQALLERIRREVAPQAGLVAPFIFHDPELHALELERIFLRVWLFVGHESEIPRPGDWVQREMGEHPVLVVRTPAGIQVYLNFCRHRGMPLCRSDRGHGASFTCPYHGFTYNLEGQLTGIPFQHESYGPELRREDLALIKARVETYHGLIFATWNPAAPPLDAYLGDARWYLDLVAHHAEMEVAGPPHRWVVDSNWKLAAENFMDSYHLMYAHGSAAKIGIVPSGDHYRRGYQVVLGQGHGLNLGMPAAQPIYPPEILQQMPRYLSPAQLAVMHRLNNLNGTLFPNLSIHISSLWLEGRLAAFSSLRQWQPKGPHQLTVYAWILVERDADPRWKAMARDAAVFTFSPSGILEQDDTEVWAHVFRNVRLPLLESRGVQLDYRMGRPETPPVDFPGPGTVYPGKFWEASARAFYEHWRSLMLDEGMQEAGQEKASELPAMRPHG
jgi:nitrite reductase/ring-hydroxylating ferredoxin subunit